MNKRFKIVYYLLIALFTMVFTYQIYLLVNVLLDKPHYSVGTITDGD